MKPLLTAVLCAATIALPLTARAGEVYNREVHQQHRIQQGVRSGTLDRREYAQLERRERNINAARVRDLRRNDGHLTPQEYRNLNRRENNASRAIYREKHDRD